MGDPIHGGAVTAPSSAAPGRSVLVAQRLSVMMLLEFVVFGAWFATLGLVLAVHGLDSIIASAYFLSAVAAILSPLIFGAIGDRYIPPRIVLCIAHLLGAGVMAALPSAVERGDASVTLGLIFGYMLVFQPTLGLVNSIALALLGANQKIFPYVRVFGPLGWVVAGLGVGAMGFSSSTGVFMVAAASSLVLALYALTLPATPPPARGSKFSLADLVGARAFVLFKQRNFSVLMICTLLTSISLGVYNSFASPYLSVVGISNVAGVLAIGQASEVLFIATIPAVLRWIGLKPALLLGMAMWGVRFVLFMVASHGENFYAIAAIALHGICNDYFIVIAAMYIGRIAPPELAAQAQGWLILMISGFGAAMGSLISGHIYGSMVAPNAALGPEAWIPLWTPPVFLAGVTALLWLLLFRSPPREAAEPKPMAGAHV